MTLIEHFVGRYRKEFDFYDQAARLAAQIVDQSIQSAGIRAIVTFRAKSPARLEQKISQRAAEKRYQTVDDIFRDIIDLAGVRIAVCFPGERDQVGKMICQLFVLECPPKEFPASSRSTYAKRFSGYWATHYRVRLRDASLNDAQKRYGEAVIEIQVASVLMHAWAEIEHDLVYKPLQGTLSEDEYAILDELNGLVLAGEIALERLQRAGENRVAAKGRRFSNHYDLAAYLLDRAAPILESSKSEAILGRVDVLYELLKAIDCATPDKLQPYLALLTSDFERRPLAEQIIDQMLDEAPDRYQIYEDLRARLAAQARPSPEPRQLESEPPQNAVGQFLSRWIDFERAMRELAASQSIEPHYSRATAKLLEGVLSPDALKEIHRANGTRANPGNAPERSAADKLEETSRRLAQMASAVKTKKRAKGRKRPRRSKGRESQP